MAFFEVLARTTFHTVPRELEEAAVVDGNSRPGAFFNIVLPLARNGVRVCAILTFMSAFGEYIFSKSIIPEPQSAMPGRLIGYNTLSVKLQKDFRPASGRRNIAPLG